MGVVRVDHQRYAKGLEAATSQFRPMSAGGWRQGITEHMGEVDPALFDQRAVFHHAGTTTAATGTLPAVFKEALAAVFSSQGGTNALLQVEQVSLHGLGAITHGGHLVVALAGSAGIQWSCRRGCRPRITWAGGAGRQA